jgi:magnesium chelatase family protein
MRQLMRFQRGRNGELLRYTCNAEIAASDIWDLCRLDAGGNALLQTAMHRLDLSARAFHRVVKVARTIADLAGSEAIVTAHLAEALQYRSRLLAG